MRSHKNRLDKLSQRIPADEEDTIIIIRLAWPEDDITPPVVYRRGADGTLIKKVGIDTVPAHLAGAEVTLHWEEHEETSTK